LGLIFGFRDDSGGLGGFQINLLLAQRGVSMLAFGPVPMAMHPFSSTTNNKATTVETISFLISVTVLSSLV
jgi:hypothetical protein